MWRAELAKMLLEEKISREKERLTTDYWWNIYRELGEEFRRIAGAYKLLDDQIVCHVVPEKYAGRVPTSSSAAKAFLEMLSAERASKTGRGLLLRCNLREHYGDASASEAKGFEGRVVEAGGKAMDKGGEKAVFFATLNALYSFAGLVDKTVHCRAEQMDACGHDLVNYIEDKYGRDVRVAHIGYKPEHVKPLVKAFKTYVTDLNPPLAKDRPRSVRVLDESKNPEVIKRADVVCIPGCSAVNGTLPGLLRWCEEHNTPALLYGITVAACSKILNLPYFCPYARRSP